MRLTVCAILLVAITLTAAHIQSVQGDPGGATMAGTAKPLRDIPIAQWFQGYFISITKAKPFRVTFPANMGFALTDLLPDEANGGKLVQIKVNGVPVRWTVIGWIGGSTHANAISVDSPIVVPPGATLEISRTDTQAINLNVGGYFLTLADLGLE